ncbi:unnamed protein product [Dicrocoelium dendriticum]|nr:unnamed protein product [Dicrocoelium dendriticum]
MRDNVNRVLEREAKLTEIDSRADDLQVQSRQFEAVSARVRRKYFWQNMKMWGIIAMVGVALIVVVIEHHLKWWIGSRTLLGVQLNFHSTPISLT